MATQKNKKHQSLFLNSSPKVCEGLFPAYQLPNGKQAFMYYNGGQLLDEVGSLEECARS